MKNSEEMEYFYVSIPNNLYTSLKQCYLLPKDEIGQIGFNLNKRKFNTDN